ncbi:MAG TPA: alpha/beta hydrolase [Allosphingosinicella sp.]|nr:alpha/beta hydrolase [Allosphingosinicella sp.]
MNRRLFILGLCGTALLPGCGAGVQAAPFAPARFSVEVRGSGPDVILIPGLTEGPEVWASAVRAVPGYRYHLIHVAGFAGAPARGNARGPMVAPLARELVRYIEEQRLRRPAIIGHSMGGTLAMMLAADHPRLIGRVMVVDMLPAPAGLFGQTTADASSIARGIAGLTETESGRRLFSSFVGMFAPEGSSFRTSDPAVVGRAMNELAAIDLTGRLPEIRVPLTVAYASPHARAGAAMDRQFARAYAGARQARFVRIDNSGHMIMYDQPARLEQAIRDFLGR